MDNTPSDVELLEQEVTDLEAQLGYYKSLAADGPRDFSTTAVAIMARDNCDGTTALRKARQEAPRAFEAYQGVATTADEDLGTDFNKLVEAEIRKGTPRAIAGQRVLLKYGARPNASQVRKSQDATGDFMAEVDAVMIEKRCPRSTAMQEARKRHPDLFAAYRGV